MADIEKMKVNLAKNEEKLVKKVALLGKYEAKKAKLSAQWKKLTGEEFADTIKLMEAKTDDLGIYGKLSKYYSKEVADMYFDVISFYDYSKFSDNPIVQTENAIKEMEARCQKYRDSIAEEEKKVADRNASVEANSVSVNGKSVNVIMEFLDNWEKETTEYFMSIFNRFVKEHKSYYAEHVENSIEYIVYNKVYENRDKMDDLWANSGYVEFYPTYTDYMKATDKSACYKAIRDNLNKKIEAYESAFSIKIIEKWGSKWHPNEEMFEANMRKDIAKEKNRKYDQLIKDVEKICGKIIDMSHIKVGPTSDLEGYVVGEKGECCLWTKGCGGFNENVIVNVKHGQCFHFRFYIKRKM